jgi:hypothetical protein
MYHAIHLVSQSCDHYNFLIYAPTIQGLVEKVKQQCGDFAYIDQAWVNSEQERFSSMFHEALSEAIALAYAEEEEQ